MREGNFLGSMFRRSDELRNEAEAVKREGIANYLTASQQREREQMTEGERLVEKYQNTVAYLNDLLAATHREKGWVEIDDLKLTKPRVGESFLVLRQKRADEGGYVDDNDLGVPIDAQHAVAVRELLALSYEERYAMLEAGFYKEPEREEHTGSEEEKLDKRHSGITRQLYILLQSKGRSEDATAGYQYVATHEEEEVESNPWWQKLEVVTTEELQK